MRRYSSDGPVKDSRRCTSLIGRLRSSEVALRSGLVHVARLTSAGRFRPASVRAALRFLAARSATATARADRIEPHENVDAVRNHRAAPTSSISSTIAKVARSAPASISMRTPARTTSRTIGDLARVEFGISDGTDLTTLAIRTSNAGRGGAAGAGSRLSFEAHHLSMLAAYPARLLKSSARSPLDRHASPRCGFRASSSSGILSTARREVVTETDLQLALQPCERVLRARDVRQLAVDLAASMRRARMLTCDSERRNNDL